MGWSHEAIGKRVLIEDSLAFYVIGVIGDIYTNGFSGVIDPLVIRFTDESNYRFLTIRALPGKSEEVKEFMMQKWSGLFDRLFEGRIIWEDLEGSVGVNMSATKVLVFLGIVALLLSLTGLFTLVSLNIIKKTKEIGIRKVLGAGFAKIVLTINKKLLIVLVSSSVLGALLGSYLGSILMDQVYIHHIPMNIPSIIMTVTLMLLVSLLTVGHKVYAAASTNPVNTLRSE